jgi:hypothetical protein
MTTFEDSDGPRDRFDDRPRVFTLGAFGQLLPLLVGDAFPVLARDQPQPGDWVVVDATRRRLSSSPTLTTAEVHRMSEANDIRGKVTIIPTSGALVTSR